MLAYNVHIPLIHATCGEKVILEVNAWNEKASLYKFRGLKKDYYFKNMPITNITDLEFEVVKNVEEIQKEKIKKAHPFLRSVMFYALAEAAGYNGMDGAVIGAVSAVDEVKTKTKKKISTFVAFGIRWKEAEGERDFIGAYEFDGNKTNSIGGNLNYLKQVLRKRGIEV